MWRGFGKKLKSCLSLSKNVELKNIFYLQYEMKCVKIKKIKERREKDGRKDIICFGGNESKI